MISALSSICRLSIGGIMLAAWVAGVGAQVPTKPDAVVTITNTMVAPAEVRVRVGGSVTWRSSGSRFYSIVSETNEWTSFNLAPGAKHMETFHRIGRFPYTIDNSRNGVVIVLPQPGSTPDGSGIGGERPGPGKSGNRTFSYVVDLSVSYHRHSEKPYPTGPLIDDLTYSSTAHWPTVNFKLILGPDGKPLALALEPVHSGTFQASAKFSYDGQPGTYDHLTCQGELVGQTYDAGLLVGVYLNLGDRKENKISFVGQTQDAGLAFARNLKSEEGTRCRGRASKSGGITDLSFNLSMIGAPSFSLPDGIKFDILSPLAVNWGASAIGTLPFPLGELLAGRSFSVDSGKQSTGSGEEETSVHIEFKAR